MTRAVRLDDLGLDTGGHLLVKLALAGADAGERVEIFGRAPHLAIHLAAWCRGAGHVFGLDEQAGAGRVGWVVKGAAPGGRWALAERAGAARGETAVVDHPSPRWGLAGRGALVEAGGPDFHFPLAAKSHVWADEALRLYEQAAAAQWDPATAIDWRPPVLPDAVEDAVVQVMTYLVENETAALLVPARFLAQIHPHFREVMQLFAIQCADEARHIEVFTRRALLRRSELGLSTVGGQLSLKTLLDEPDFALASFLLSVLGEGSFLSLLWFLHRHAPDPVTAEVARLAAQDEARHVAFGLAHLQRHVGQDPSLRARLAAAVERRHQALRHTAGLNDEVFDALLLLAAGSIVPDDVRRGHAAVLDLQRDMDDGRRRRLARLGFTAAEAETLSALHTRNFM
jgi:hypothetical protein